MGLFESLFGVELEDNYDDIKGLKNELKSLQEDNNKLTKRLREYKFSSLSISKEDVSSFLNQTVMYDINGSEVVCLLLGNNRSVIPLDTVNRHIINKGGYNYLDRGGVRPNVIEKILQSVISLADSKEVINGLYETKEEAKSAYCKKKSWELESAKSEVSKLEESLKECNLTQTNGVQSKKKD